MFGTKFKTRIDLGIKSRGVGIFIPRADNPNEFFEFVTSQRFTINVGGDEYTTFVCKACRSANQTASYLPNGKFTRDGTALCDVNHLMDPEKHLCLSGVASSKRKRIEPPISDEDQNMLHSIDESLNKANLFAPGVTKSSTSWQSLLSTKVSGPIQVNSPAVIGIGYKKFGAVVLLDSMAGPEYVYELVPCQRKLLSSNGVLYRVFCCKTCKMLNVKRSAGGLPNIRLRTSDNTFYSDPTPLQNPTNHLCGPGRLRSSVECEQRRRKFVKDAMMKNDQQQSAEASKNDEHCSFFEQATDEETPCLDDEAAHSSKVPSCPKKFYGSNDATRHCVTHTPPATPIKENDEVIERLVFDVAKRNFPANASEIDEYFEIKHRYRGNLPTQTLEEATATTMYFQNESGMSDSNTDFCDESQNMEQSFMTMPKSEKQDVNPSPSSSTTQNQEGSENNGEISDFTKQIQAELLEAMKKVSELTAKVNELENENNRLYALLGRAEADKARLNDTITRLSKQ